MTLGEKIAKQRKELNFTQEQLADILGVSRQSISKWESDIAYPETDKLIELGKLFDCSMDYLLKEDVTEKQSTVTKETEKIWDKFKKQFHERKSEKMVCGMRPGVKFCVSDFRQSQEWRWKAGRILA